MDTLSTYPTLSRFVTSGGTIDIGRIDVLDCAAVASDTANLWVLLMRRPDEGLMALLRRLDDSLAFCLENKTCIDELRKAAPATDPQATSQSGRAI
jgi:hypothetical protein